MRCYHAGDIIAPSCTLKAGPERETCPFVTDLYAINGERIFPEQAKSDDTEPPMM